VRLPVARQPPHERLFARRRGELPDLGRDEVRDTLCRRIPRRVVGRINAGRMVLGVGGYVEGDIVATDVVLCGRLEGRIFAFNVTIAPSAIIKGRVFHHTLTVAKEAQIEGRMPWRPINFFETLGELPKET